MQSITNESFLKTIFKDDYTNALVCAFSNPPDKTSRRDWFVVPYKFEGKSKLANAKSSNTYFCISTFNPGKDKLKRRRKAFHKATYIIPFDDVGTKVNPRVLIDRGLTPSYRLETSPGNEQWGFILSVPEKRKWAVEQLQKHIIKHGLMTEGKDPGQNGVTRIIRLPEGVNNKSKYMQELGRPFEHRLLEWNPHITYTIEELAEIFGCRLVPPDEQKEALKSSLALQPDMILKHLESEGLVKGEILGKPGFYDIVCPWVDAHTGGDDTGTAYMSPGYDEHGIAYPQGGFCCHHGSCADRHISDVQTFLFDKGYRDTGAIAERFDEYPPLPVEEKKTLEEIKPEQIKKSIYRWGNELGGATRQPFVVENLLELGRSMVLFGKWKSGKSLIALHLALALAHGREFGKSRTLKSFVVYIAGEGVQDTVDRIAAYKIEHGLDDEFPFIMRTRPVALTNDKAAALLLAEILHFQKQVPDLPIVIIIDTLAKNFGNGKTENADADMNSFTANVTDTIARPLNAAIIIVHHTGHTNQDRVRGHSSLSANTDLTCRVTRADIDTVKMQLDFARNIQGEASYIFKIKSIDLGVTDNFDNPQTSPVLTFEPGLEFEEVTGIRAAISALIEDEEEGIKFETVKDIRYAIIPEELVRLVFYRCSGIKSKRSAYNRERAKMGEEYDAKKCVFRVKIEV